MNPELLVNCDVYVGQVLVSVDEIVISPSADLVTVVAPLPLILSVVFPD